MGSTEYGYLGLDYLGYPYLAGTINEFFGMQINQQIDARVNAGFSVSATAANNNLVGQQANMLTSGSPVVGMQTYMQLDSQKIVGQQASMLVTDRQANVGQQVSASILDKRYNGGMQFKADTLRHRMVGIYLSWPYLSEPYLSEKMQALVAMQVNAIAFLQKDTGMQVNRVINARVNIGMQISARINTQLNRGMQVQAFQRTLISQQATMVIYNVTQLRLMYTFPSRGTPDLLGLNWVANSTASGDFSANNLNTDVIEEIFKSGPGSASNVVLTCDTGITQGVPIDTIAILGHNLSRSALVQVQGSNDNFATSPRITFNLTVETLNMYYIAPSFPTSEGQNRYWRFIFSDATNSDGYVSIGTILFGAADIFSVSENFRNPIRHGEKHFKDTNPTEGFTGDTNDRALKRYLSLSFQDLKYTEGNIRKIEAMLAYSRTGLKTLVIPTPEFPSRFAVYAKLTTMPDKTTISNGPLEQFTTVSLDWDEAL